MILFMHFKRLIHNLAQSKMVSTANPNGVHIRSLHLVKKEFFDALDYTVHDNL